VRERIAGGMRGSRASVMALVLLISALQASARSAESADTALVYRWSAAYRSRIDIKRMPLSFPWNDKEAFSHRNDRLAVLGELVWRNNLSFFAKGATGFRLGGDYQDERFILDQGHVGFELLGEAVTGRIFSRERVYRTDQRLLTLLSDESAIVGLGEGVALEVNAGAHVSLSYIESVLRPDFAIRGGLPSFQSAEEYLRAVRMEAFQRGIVHAGFTLSELHLKGLDDWITTGADLGFAVRGIDVLAELARTQRGGWNELRANSLFDLNWRRARFDRFSGLFSDENAFATEIEGLRVGMHRFGVLNIVPGYRYCGSAFSNPAGETERHLREGYVHAWWKSAGYDALVSVDASSGMRYGRDFSRLIASARGRYRGGFELRQNIMCTTGARSSAAVSLIDDNALTRLVVTARVDDLGAGNVFSYLARGTVNLGSRVAARSALFLYRSRTSLYDVEIEFRPRGSYLFQAAFGSFTPRFEGLTLDREFDLYTLELAPPSKDRFILFFTRIWFGGEGAK